MKTNSCPASHAGEGGQTLTFAGGKIKSSGLVPQMTLARDSCGGGENGTEDVTGFFVEKGKPLELSFKTYRRKCKAGEKDFRFLSKKPVDGC